MVQLALPAASVVPVQLCWLPTGPSVSSTVLPPNGTVSVSAGNPGPTPRVRLADIVNGVPFTAMVGPV